MIFWHYISKLFNKLNKLQMLSSLIKVIFIFIQFIFMLISFESQYKQLICSLLSIFDHEVVVCSNDFGSSFENIIFL